MKTLHILLDCFGISLKERKCPVGFLVVRGECIDFDECEKQNGFCHEHVHCMNTIGSYICGCRNGYDTVTEVNWELRITEPNCVDIDECRNRDTCRKKSTCKNTDGSYICQCDPGFRGDLCEDIDECNQTSTCDVNAACLNTEGSYICSCNSGYRGNGKTCKRGQCDDQRCPLDQKCVSPTNNECECNAGLSYNNMTDFCEDVDECLLDHGCDQITTCVNSKGSFSCDCNPGYVGDGKTCVEGTCIDDMCPMNAECVSSVKSDCRCKSGYELKSLNSNETEICVDTDECATLRGLCHEKAVCKNIPGGYECNCQQGYFGDGQTCFRGSCTEINCPPSDYKECVSPRGNLCKCTDGFTFNNASDCVDVNECKEEPCGQDENCVNASGKYSCWMKTVLVLYYVGRKIEHKSPFLIDAEGRSDSDVTISFGDFTEVSQSCSVTFRNKFYIFGGRIRKKQISEVTKCEVKRIGTLDFFHYYGACSNFDDREIFLCFDYNDPKQCRSGFDPLGNFTTIAPSTYDHGMARTAVSPSKFLVFLFFLIFSAQLLAVGSKTEVYVIKDGRWLTLDDFGMKNTFYKFFKHFFNS